MRQFRLALASCALLASSGCAEVLHEYWFSADGSARVVVDVALPRAMVHLAGRDVVLALREEAKQAEATLREDPAVTAVRFRDHVAGDLHHLAWELEVNDATRLPALFRAARARASADRMKELPALDLAVDRTVLGDQVLVLRLMPGATLDAGRAARETWTPARKLADAMLGERHLTVRVHGPAIGETNGTVSEQRDQAEWRIPLGDLLTDEPPPLELRAVVKTGAPMWMWAVLLGLPALLLWAVIRATKRRRRPSADA
jgi:hypothetical protein